MVEENKGKQPTLEEPEERALIQRKIDTELNIEKWSIWLPSHSKEAKKLKRILKRTKLLEDGSKIEIKLTLRRSGELTQLTTEDERTFYVLEEILEEAIKEALNEGITKEELLSKENFEVKATSREIFKRLNIKLGGRQWKSLKNSLLRLRLTGCVWENSFYDSKERRTLELLDTFNILSKLKLARSKKEKKKEEDPERFILKFAFHPYIFRNMVNNYTKPKYLNVIFSLSERAQMFYRHIDLVMSKNLYYERRTESLFFEDLGLESKRYESVKERKRTLQQILNEIKAKNTIFTTGTLSFDLFKTTDGKDYKLICKKTPFTKPLKENLEQLELKKVEKTSEQPEELVKYFHQTLNHQDYQPTKKEIEQATYLINQYGFEDAKYIVDYALEKAESTNFKNKMQFLGTIFQYIKDASKEIERKKRAKHYTLWICQNPYCENSKMSILTPKKELLISQCPDCNSSIEILNPDYLEYSDEKSIKKNLRKKV